MDTKTHWDKVYKAKAPEEVEFGIVRTSKHPSI